MTFLQDMRIRAVKEACGKAGGWGTLAEKTGTNVTLLSEILSGKKPMPAQLWEHLIKVKLK